MTPAGPAIHLVENHDDAYRLWRAAAVRDRVLVHVDAHHDMWWVESERRLSIANFICPALRNGFVREVYWVVPDRSFATPANREAVGEHVRRIVNGYPGEPAGIQGDERGMRTAVLGRPLIVCALDALPVIAEPVLLDIDTDYLVLPRVTYGRRDRPAARPWRWPDDLVARLEARRIAADIVTIAYSVDGGYTPIGWKYLGDELAYRLRALRAPFDGGDPVISAFRAMRDGVTAARRRPELAEAAFLRAGDEVGAAAYFQLAFLLAAQGRVEEGRRWYEKAVARDPSYRAPFATPGVPLYLGRAHKKADAAFRLAASLDPKDACAHVGLAWTAARRRRWPEAEVSARAALHRNPSSIDAHRALADALEHQGRVADAIIAYERSLLLALKGGRPFNAVAGANGERDQLLDTDHARTHAHLARLHERSGDLSRAITGYRLAVAGGHEDPSTRRRLARLLERIS